MQLRSATPTGNIPEAQGHLAIRDKILVPSGVCYKGVHCKCYEQPIIIYVTNNLYLN